MRHSLSVTFSPVARGAPPRCAPCCPAAGLRAHGAEHRTALRCASSSAAPAETATLHNSSSPAPAHQSVLPAGVGVSVVSDSAVPEAHAGLHTSLYGQSTSGADVHDSSHSYQAVEVRATGPARWPCQHLTQPCNCATFLVVALACRARTTAQVSCPSPAGWRRGRGRWCRACTRSTTRHRHCSWCPTPATSSSRSEATWCVSQRIALCVCTLPLSSSP